MIIAKSSLEEKKLYKFRSIQKDSANPDIPDENKLDYVRRIFTYNELYFPSPIELNDPLECRPAFTIGNLSDSDYKDSYLKRVREMMVNGNNQNVPKKIEDWLSSMSQGEAESLLRDGSEDLRQALNKYRICSFCAKPDNPIVWSHYADSHSGFCLVFDANNDVFGSAIKVEYQLEYPIIDIIEDDDFVILKNAALVKYSDWNYENEYRLISAEPNFSGGLPVTNKKFIYPPDMLIGVIFGCKINEQDKELIKTWCGERPDEFYKDARLGHDKYTLDIV